MCPFGSARCDVIPAELIRGAELPPSAAVGPSVLDRSPRPLGTDVDRVIVFVPIPPSLCVELVFERDDRGDAEYRELICEGAGTWAPDAMDEVEADAGR